MTFAPGDTRDICIYGGRFRAVFPIFLSTGVAPVGTPTGLDSEYSLDQGTFADCVNEAIRILGGTVADGIFYLDLVAAETTGKHVCIRIRHTTTGFTNTVLSIPIIRLPILESGTAQAGAAGTITLAAGAASTDSYYNGLYVQITNNTPTNVQGMTRKIISYVGSTRVATIESNWGTNPSNASTYSILVPLTVSAAGFTADAASKVADAVVGHPGADPTVVPTATAGLQAKVDWICSWFRNKQTMNRTTGVVNLRNDADSATIGTMTVTDDGTTMTRPEIT